MFLEFGLRRLLCVALLLAFTSSSLWSQQRTRQSQVDRERFQPAFDSARASFEAKYNAFKSSYADLEEEEQEAYAELVAKALFSASFSNFRDRERVESLLDWFIRDLDNFLGNPNDPGSEDKLRMLGMLQKSLNEELEVMRASASRKSSEDTQFWLALSAGVTVTASVHLLAYSIYRLSVNFPRYAEGLRSWTRTSLKKTSLRIQLLLAHRAKNFSKLESCKTQLAELARTKRERPLKAKRNWTKTLGRLSFWLLIDGVAASGLAWAGHYFLYKDLIEWRAQELFVTDQFDEWALQKKRLGTPHQKSLSDKTSREKSGSP
jgi:hypothetical protein